jgi:hypothetical protein
MFDKLKAKGFQIEMLHHAAAILEHDMAEAVDDLECALLQVSIPVDELVRGGGGEGLLTQRMRKCFAAEHDWKKHTFQIEKIVDGVKKESITHEIDHVKFLPAGTFALEIEWNNKDPFYDRDLENFKRLHADGVISVGGIITRGKSLQDGLRELIESFAKRNKIDSFQKLNAFYTPTPRQERIYKQAAIAKRSFEKGWAEAFVADKFGEATTHWRKLEDRVHRGVGNPCPLVLIGIPITVVTP